MDTQEQPVMEKQSQFRKDLEKVINKHSMENGSDTPDFILAEYLADCLAAFDNTMSKREIWYGRKSEEVKTREI